jgi:hypothetical protein
MQVTPRPSVLRRVSAQLAAVPLPRLRRILIAFYLLAVLGDAAGKVLATSDTANRAAARALDPAHAAKVASAGRKRGNFEIFRAASRRLVAGEDMYALDLSRLQDQYKYSPAFALLFSPFAWLPWPLALVLWNGLNAFVLFAAIERLLPPRPALMALCALLPEVIRAMQNAQSNALVAGLVILAFVALEGGRIWRAALAVALGASVKIFPLAALTFAIPKRKALRTGIATAVIGVSLLLVPLLATPPATLLAQYRSWRRVEQGDIPERWFSFMELLHRVIGTTLPNWPVQVGGTLLLLAPLMLGRVRWNELRFRRLYLCSVLLFMVLFNHQAERAAYVIAFAGIAIWFVSEPRTVWRTALFGLAFLTIPLMSTLIPVPAAFRTPLAMVLRLALPTLLVWVAIQVELWRDAGRSETEARERSAAMLEAAG